MTEQRKASGRIGTRPVEFIPTHRDGNPSPAVMRVSMTVPVSLEDVTAALWILVDDGMPLDELEDDAFAHEMVCETLFAKGGSAIEATRHEIAQLPADSVRAETAEMLRARVAELYGHTVPAPRTDLAGVV